ncbi:MULTISPECIES: polyamine aminopropyltransferase [Vibrio]|uniref:polyamine aminopropyltransferase n=1 Tax=Vibrio TaxID=662 RepID=UPI000A83AEAB|nr:MULTISPECIES: polyamine aminopropyltransferase [Vibrio]
MAETTTIQMTKTHSLTLIYAAFIAGLCSIIYELLIATTASYFLGDSVKYFSLTIGIYMAAMGVGSFVSKYMDKNLLRKFIVAELLLGLCGGMSIPLLYFSYAYTEAFIYFYVVLTIVIGFLIGLEIPFLTRLMEDYNQLKFNIANILSFDYLGALIATVSFPFILLPFFGVYQSSLIFGLVNMSIGFVVLWVFADELDKSANKLKGVTVLLTSLMIAMIVFSGWALKHWDSRLYQDRVIYSEQSRYQKIVLTRHKDDVRLYLDGNLQFSSVDEHRYHESLVHVPLSVHNKPVRRVLLLGAGDGLAVRELLKYPAIEEVVLVDLDNSIIRLAKENHQVRQLNRDSLVSDRVTINITDAFSYLNDNKQLFDFIIGDLPDPNNNALARLYSKQFYQLIRSNLAEDGVFVTQATSPYFATDAFWSINRTVQAAGFNFVQPYHAQVPSFGEWGFVMASSIQKDVSQPEISVDTRFLDESSFANLFVFEKDIRSDNVEVNELDQPILLSYYLKGWKYYAR